MVGKKNRRSGKQGTNAQKIMNEICDAHQQGQIFAGYKHPSWSEAFAYWKTVEGKFTSMKSIKVHYEIISARKYYGPIGSMGQQHPVRGSVLLVNGYPEFHSTTSEVKKIYRNLLERGKRYVTFSKGQ